MTVPVDFIPDQQFNLNRAKNFATANDLMLYKYAPGTKTLGSQQLDESIRSARAQEELDAQRLAEETRQANARTAYDYAALDETKRNNDLDTLAASLAAAQKAMTYQNTQNAANETTVQSYVNAILKELSPTKRTDKITGKTTFNNDNIHYRNGHAYPKEALQKYQSIIGNDAIYNEVYRRIMGQYAPAVQKSGTNGVSDFRQLDQISSNQAQNW